MRFILTAVTILVFPMAASAQVTTFENDYEGFLEAAGVVSTIDFETLPNGDPSQAGVDITDEFNYDAQGAHFSAPIGIPEIHGNPDSGFGLFVSGGSEDTWLVSSLLEPARAAGVFFGGHSTVSIYGLDDTLLETRFLGGCAELCFLGFVSDIPIGYVITERESNEARIDEFAFAPVPEPGTLALLASGAVLVIRRRPRGS